MTNNKTPRTTKIAIILIIAGVLTVCASIFWGNKFGLSALQYISGLLGLASVCLGISFTIFPLPLEERKRKGKIILGLSIFLCAIPVILIKYFQIHSIVFISGFFLLAFTYLPLLTKNRVEKWKQYTRKTRHAFLLSFGDLISLSTLILGFLFKIMQWPGANNMFLFGIVILSISLISWNRLFSKEVILRKEAENKVKSAFDELKDQHLIIQEKNKDILDSINYAKRIQRAKLPKKEDIYTSLPGCFILFKPKDIVSGDFYSFHKNEKSVFIASADCTGHGVPGALMSMIGLEKLEDAFSQSTDTSEILKLLNKGIKASLKQSDDGESTRDGMDIALCSVDTNTRIVNYAGANRPLWIIRNGQTTIEEIKATKKAIAGFTEDDQHFEAHQVQLQQNDTFYIFTDGYADQFNGKNGKKLMTKKFKEILIEIQHKSMQEQENYLDNFIENWKSGTEQIDDILVIGIRL